MNWYVPLSLAAGLVLCGQLSEAQTATPTPSQVNPFAAANPTTSAATGTPDVSTYSRGITQNPANNPYYNLYNNPYHNHYVSRKHSFKRKARPGQTVGAPAPVPGQLANPFAQLPTQTMK